MGLSEEQRWLLAGVGGWQMADCLAHPDRGIAALMTSMYGSSSARRDDRYPDWLSAGFACGYGRIVSPGLVRDGSARRVEVTNVQLAGFARDVDPEVRVRVREVRNTQQQEAQRWASSCHCGRGTEWHQLETDPMWRSRWHPTPEQDAAHRAYDLLLDEAVNELILEACNLIVPTGQLALFGPGPKR